MRMRTAWMLFGWLVFGLAAQEPAAAPTVLVADEPALQIPFVVGERLTYSLVWNKVPVGELVICVLPMGTIRGEKAWHFTMQAETNDYADKIYKVRTAIHSYVSEDLRRSLRYVSRQAHGDDRKWVLLDFFWDQNRVKFMKNAEDRGLRPVKPNAQDPLSMFFYVRALELKEKKRIEIRVCDGKRCVDSGADIVRREKVEANGKTYDAYLIEPELQDIGGVFEKSKNAKLEIWVSDDADRLPLRITSEVMVGKFYATLSKYEKVEFKDRAEPPANE